MEYLNIRVSLPTAALASLEAHASDAHPLESLIALAVTRAGHLPPGGRCLVLSADQLDRVEQALGGISGTIATGDQLVTRLDAQMTVSIGGVTVPFSKAELAEIKLRAGKRGQTPQQFVEGVVRALHDQFFTAPLPEVPVVPAAPVVVDPPKVTRDTGKSPKGAPLPAPQAPTHAVATQTQPPTPQAPRGAPPRPVPSPQVTATATRAAQPASPVEAPR